VNDPGASLPPRALRSRGPFRSADGADTGRLEGFSDGVYAIAITLLVLNFSIPDRLADSQVWTAISAQGAQFLSAALSFAVIAIYWSSHHGMFRWIRRSSGGLVVANFAHLATIVFLPFPTLVLAEYSDSFAAVALYAATLALVGYSSVAITWVAWRQRLVAPEVDLRWVESRITGLATTPTVFVLSIAVAWISPSAATYFWLLALVVGRPVSMLMARVLD